VGRCGRRGSRGSRWSGFDPEHRRTCRGQLRNNRAAVGYCLPFLFVLINWRRLNLQWGLRYLAKLPLVCLISGVVLQIAGTKGLQERGALSGIYRIDQGVARLQGASTPALLASLALVGLASALCLAASSSADRGLRSLLWVGINFAIVLATVTRAQTAVSIALIVTFIVVHALGRNRLQTLRGRRTSWLIAALAIAGCAVAAPALIKRTTGSIYEAGFNTSGRKYIWQFFQGFVAENPLTGKGLGFSSIAVQLYSPPNISKTIQSPHNEYLHFSVDGGIFFAVGLFLVILSAFVTTARAQRGAVRALVVVFALATMCLAFVENTFPTPQFSVVAVILLCLLAAHPSNPKNFPGKHSATACDRGGKLAAEQARSECNDPEAARPAEVTQSGSGNGVIRLDIR
jgi:hypothetical protein